MLGELEGEGKVRTRREETDELGERSFVTFRAHFKVGDVEAEDGGEALGEAEGGRDVVPLEGKGDGELPLKVKVVGR